MRKQPGFFRPFFFLPGPREAPNCRLCFGSSERYNCVTLDGTFIKKSGLITGGVASLQGKSQQWGQKAVHELKAKRVRVHTELEELKQKITPEHEVAELEAQVELLAERLRAVQQELLLAKEKLGQLQKESQGLARHLDTLKVESLLKEVDRATHDLSLLETKKSEIVNSVFCDFCKKLNISTIREFEGTSLKEAREVNEKRLQFRTVISKLKTELEYERSRNTASVLLQLQKQMDEEENSLKFLRKNCEVLAAKQLKCRDELNAAEQHHLEAAELLKKSAAEAKAILKELAAHKAAHSALLSSLSELVPVALCLCSQPPSDAPCEPIEKGKRGG
jgi:structural maintenance of chromosome 1